MNEAVRWDCCEPENRLGPPMKHPLHLGGDWCFLPPTDRCPVFFCFVLFVCFFQEKASRFLVNSSSFKKKNWQLLKNDKVQYRANCSGLSLIGFQSVFQAYVLADSLVQGDTQYLPKRQPYCSLDVLQMWRPRMWRRLQTDPLVSLPLCKHIQKVKVLVTVMSDSL